MTTTDDLTPDDALTAALAIGELIFEHQESSDQDEVFERYSALRDLIYSRKISNETREGKLINLLLDIADDEFDL